MQLLDLRGQLIAVAAGGTVDDFLVPAASFASDSEAAGLEGAFATSGAVSTTRVLGQAAKEGIAIYSVTAENFDEVRPSLVVDSGTLRQITEAVQMGATVTLPQRTPTIDGWAGSAYIVQHDGSLAYRISGGMNGAIKKLDGPQGPYLEMAQTLSYLLSGDYEDRVACGMALLVAFFELAFHVAGSGVILLVTHPIGWIATAIAMALAVFVAVWLFLISVLLHEELQNRCRYGGADA